jgi:chromosome segregation ATPase
MNLARSNVFELPTAANMRARLASLEAENTKLKTGGAEDDSQLAEALAERDRFSKASLALAQMFLAGQSIAEGLEEICDTERARADEAERRAAAASGDARARLALIHARDRRLHEVALEIDGLRAELERVRAEASRAKGEHEAGIASLRAALDVSQADLAAAQARARDLEKQLAALREERAKDGALAIGVAEVCARLAESRAEGWAIAAEIRGILRSLPSHALA